MNSRSATGIPAALVLALVSVVPACGVIDDPNVGDGNEGDDHHHSGGVGSPDGGNDDHAGHGEHPYPGGWPPWPSYYEEYPEKYRHLLYDPARHPGGGPSHGDHAAMHPEDDCHANPPTHEQIRAANDFAVRTAIHLESAYPTFPDQASFEVPNHALYGFPGLNLGGYHYANLEGWFDDKFLSPEHPEYVIYSESPSGFRAVGTMPINNCTDCEPPDFGGCITQWHDHNGDGGYMLHVWTYGLETGPYSEPPEECALDLSQCLD